MNPETEQFITALEEAPSSIRIDFNPEKLELADWKLEFLETDCGSACTPNGCMGHPTDIPLALNIAGVEFKLEPDDYDHKADFSALRAVGKVLNDMINTAKKAKK